MPNDTKPLPEPMVTYQQRCSVALSWEQFHKKYLWTPQGELQSVYYDFGEDWLCYNKRIYHNKRLFWTHAFWSLSAKELDMYLFPVTTCSPSESWTYLVSRTLNGTPSSNSASTLPMNRFSITSTSIYLPGSRWVLSSFLSIDLFHNYFSSWGEQANNVY